MDDTALHHLFNFFAASVLLDQTNAAAATNPRVSTTAQSEGVAVLGMILLRNPLLQPH
jgi:hypothetical protein